MMQQFETTFEDYSVLREDVHDLRKKKFLTQTIICSQFGEEACVHMRQYLRVDICRRQHPSAPSLP